MHLAILKKLQEFLTRSSTQFAILMPVKLLALILSVHFISLAIVFNDELAAQLGGFFLSIMVLIFLCLAITTLAGNCCMSFFYEWATLLGALLQFCFEVEAHLHSANGFLEKHRKEFRLDMFLMDNFKGIACVFCYGAGVVMAWKWFQSIRDDESWRRRANQRRKNADLNINPTPYKALPTLYSLKSVAAAPLGSHEQDSDSEKTLQERSPHQNLYAPDGDAEGMATFFY